MNRVVVSGKESKSYQAPEEASGDPLGEALFTVEGVASVFATGSFVTVIKSEAAQWEAVSPAVEVVLKKHFAG